jgi:hypothetical protein
MVMAVCTMHVTVCYFFCNGRTHIDHLKLKAQGLTRPRVVAV